MVTMMTSAILTMIPQLAQHRHPLHQPGQEPRHQRQPQEHVQDHDGCPARLGFVDDDMMTGSYDQTPPPPGRPAALMRDQPGAGRRDRGI